MGYVTINAKNPVFKQGAHYQTSPYGMRFINGVNKMHNGIDMIGKYYAGDDIIAFDDGTVDTASYDSARGNYVVLRHKGGAQTHYFHMKNKPTLKAGAAVKKGDVLGYMGTTGNSTGPHLHFGIAINNVWTNPLPYLEGKNFEEEAPEPDKATYTVHVVQPGESWWSIAQDALGDGNRYMELVKYNGFTTAPVIHPGDNIRIPSEEELTEDLTEVAKRVMCGDYGNGVERVRKLTEEGYDAHAVQAIVNDMCD